MLCSERTDLQIPSGFEIWGFCNLATFIWGTVRKQRVSGRRADSASVGNMCHSWPPARQQSAKTRCECFSSRCSSEKAEKNSRNRREYRGGIFALDFFDIHWNKINPSIECNCSKTFVQLSFWTTMMRLISHKHDWDALDSNSMVQNLSAVIFDKECFEC